MPRKSSERDRPFRREQAIDFDNDFTEKKVGTDHASDAGEKKDSTYRHLNSHLETSSITKLSRTVSKIVAEAKPCELSSLERIGVSCH